MVDYLQDTIDVANSPDFDEGMFQAHLALGRAIAVQTDSHDPIPDILSMSGELSKCLALFNESWQRRTGLAMEDIWLALRPPTANTFPAFDAQIYIEEQADHFDSLSWKSGTSVNELASLRQQMIKLCQDFGVSDIGASANAMSGLEVSKE